MTQKPAILLAEDSRSATKTPAEQILEVLSPGAEARFNTLLERRVAEEVEAALGPDSPDVLMEVDVDNDGAPWVQVRDQKRAKADRRKALRDALAHVSGGGRAKKLAAYLAALAAELAAKPEV